MTEPGLEDVPLDQLNSQSTFDVPETIAAAPDDDADAPLDKRLVSAKPPTRRDAYKEVAALFEGGNAASFEEHGAGLKKALEEKAPLCHEAALDAACAFAAHAPEEMVKDVAGYGARLEPVTAQPHT